LPSLCQGVEPRAPQQADHASTLAVHRWAGRCQWRVLGSVACRGREHWVLRRGRHVICR
jgi:hypothetical protein